MGCHPVYSGSFTLQFKTESGEEFEFISPEMVRELLPHRDIALRIDSAKFFAAESRVVATRYLAPEDWDFIGHFDGKPVLPGAIQVEIAAQAAVILVKKKYPEITDWPCLSGIGRVKFKREAIPEDTLNILVSLISYHKNNPISYPFEFSFTITKKIGKFYKEVSSGTFEGKAARE